MFDTDCDTNLASKTLDSRDFSHEKTAVFPNWKMIWPYALIPTHKKNHTTAIKHFVNEILQTENRY